MDKTAEKLAAYATNLRYSDLTRKAIHAVKRSVVDSIGCALGAFQEDAVKAVRNLASQVTAIKPSTVIGTDIKSSPELAAFANGCMIRYLDFSDDYYGGTGDMGPHPSDNIGSVLAASESANTDGRSMILGVAIAYEAVGQIADKIVLDGVKPTWDYPVFHSIASSLAVGNVWGLSLKQMRHALSLAIIPNIALSQTRLGALSNWKGFRGPNGSRNGLFAALMAREGITGPSEPFEGKAGLMKHLNQTFELRQLGRKDVPFKVLGTYFKCIPVRYTAQLPVVTALELYGKVRPEDIKSISIFREMRSLMAGSVNPEYWNPTTRETADHSLPFLIGAALTDGEITEKTFTPERYRDPAILALIQKIRMVEDKQFTAAFPRVFQCRFEITLKSGEVVKIHNSNPKGTLGNPFTDQELEAKFLKLVDSVLSQQQSRILLDQLWELEKLQEIGKLFPLMNVTAALH